MGRGDVKNQHSGTPQPTFHGELFKLVIFLQNAHGLFLLVPGGGCGRCRATGDGSSVCALTLVSASRHLWGGTGGAWAYIKEDITAVHQSTDTDFLAYHPH